MGIIAWIILGLVAGFLASLIVNKRGEGFFGDILLGIIGAVVGGFVAHLCGINGVYRLNLYSILIATVGAIIVLIIYHALRGNRSTTPRV